jgi:DNA polymerase III subunit gamma/tau
MSYLVLARKWRPQLFDDLVGQEHVAQTLKNSIAADRVHHAFLFTGARGVGKTSAARIFAKALNCQEGPTATPCGVCPSCVEITSSQGIDVLEIDGASNTGVDDIRELRENIRYLPSRSRYKIFIIDEVHMLSINAFNALLKTLEEPPEHAKFIFATTEPHKIPITILSRCQRFDFKKIALTPLQDHLRYIVDQESITISDDGLAAVARSGGGSMRDALSTLDQVIAFCGEQVATDEVQKLLGLVSQRLLISTLEAVFERDPRQVLTLIQKVDDHGHSFRQFCRQLVELTRALVVLKVADKPGELIDFSETEVQELRAITVNVVIEDLQRTLENLIRTEAELATSHFPRFTIEMVLVRLSNMPAGTDIITLIKRLEGLERKLAGGLPVAQTVASSAAPAPPPDMSDAPPPPDRSDAPPSHEQTEKKSEALPVNETSDKNWAGLVAFVNGRRRPRISSLLEQSNLLLLDLPRLRIGMPSKYLSLADGDTRESIQQLAAEYFAVDVKVEYEKIGNGEKAPPSLHEERIQQESDRQKKLRENALDHPMVKSALDIFEGEVDTISPIDKGFV